uniref:Uncharacterized protein n=1 Tax=Lepeophtheirus salmonis TaxID=72036 RepID=A0A0K2VAP6_LEPSM
MRCRPSEVQILKNDSLLIFVNILLIKLYNISLSILVISVEIQSQTD